MEPEHRPIRELHAGAVFVAELADDMNLGSSGGTTAASSPGTTPLLLTRLNGAGLGGTSFAHEMAKEGAQTKTNPTVSMRLTIASSEEFWFEI